MKDASFAKNNLIIVIICIVLFILLTAAAAVLWVYDKQNNASMVISLNYAEASSGLNPNGTRFEEGMILSDTVLDSVIESLGADVSRDELASHLTVEPLSGSSGYIETSYVVKYSKINDLGLEADSVLSAVYTAYLNWFIDNYSDNPAMLQFNGVTESDYYSIICELQTAAGKITGYLNDRLKESVDFVSETTGASFVSLKGEVDTMLDISIGNLEAYVWENGLAENTADRVSILQCENYLLGIQYEKYMSSYNVRVEAIETYDEEMASTVRIPSVTTSGVYFMGRTNIGVDYLAVDADYFLQQAAYTKAEINENNDIIEKLSGTENSGADAKADEMISEIVADLTDISEKALLTDSDYMKYKTLNYMSCKIN